jgi:ABC-type multidrug transport system fused ATPase/permease subunit
MHAAGHAALAVAAGACAQALAGGGALSGGGARLPILASLAGGSGVDAALALALFGVAAVAVKVAGGTVAAYAQARICGDVGGALRLEVLDAWLAHHRLRHMRHDDHAAGAAALTAPPRRGPAQGIVALTSSVREIEAALQVGVLGGVRAVAQVVPLVLVLVWLAPRLALVAVLVFAPFSVALSSARKRWKRANARAARHGEALLEAADEAVRHAELWTTFGAEARVRTHVAAMGRALSVHAAKLESSAAGLSGANELLGALALVGALAASRAGWLGAADGARTLLPFAVTFFLAYKPLRDLTDARLAMARAAAALEAVASLTEPLRAAAEVPEDVPGRGHTPVLPDAPGAMGGASATAPPRWRLGALRLDALVLPAGSGAPIDLHVAPGALVAIVGATGSGKTTLLRVLLGLEHGRSGTIHYDDATLDDAPPGPRGRPFAWVPQDAPLLADTLDANVALGAPADARALLTTLGAGGLGDALGSSRLGAGGRVVSGGERQWIALARAVATRQPVLLLDEPTSGLDPASQARVLDAIARMKGERTIVLVTHRPEPLAIADVVVRLGEIAPVARKVVRPVPADRAS